MSKSILEMRANPSKSKGRPPARYRLTVTNESGTFTNTVKNWPEMNSWLVWYYSLGWDVEVEDRVQDIVLRTV